MLTFAERRGCNSSAVLAESLTSCLALPTSEPEALLKGWLRRGKQVLWADRLCDRHLEEGGPQGSAEGVDGKLHPIGTPDNGDFRGHGEDEAAPRAGLALALQPAATSEPAAGNRSADKHTLGELQMSSQPANFGSERICV